MGLFFVVYTDNSECLALGLTRYLLNKKNTRFLIQYLYWLTLCKINMAYIVSWVLAFYSMIIHPRFAIDVMMSVILLPHRLPPYRSVPTYPQERRLIGLFFLALYIAFACWNRTHKSSLAGRWCTNVLSCLDVIKYRPYNVVRKDNSTKRLN